MPRLFKITTWVTVVTALISCSEKELSPEVVTFKEKCLLSQRTFFYSASNLSGRTTFEYDQRGNLVIAKSQNSQNETHNSNYTNHYNELHQLEKQEKHSDGILQSQEYFTYHENRKKKSSEKHLVASNHITLNEFDEAENLVRVTRSQANAVSKDDYKYNKHGQLAYYHSTQNGKPYLERSYDYTSEGLKIQYSQLVFETKRKSIVQWEYDEHEKLISQKWHVGETHDIALTAIKHHHYDGNKRVASLKVWKEIPHKEHYRYHYNDQEQLTLIERSLDGSQYFKEKEISYHNDENEKEVKEYTQIDEHNSYLQLTQTYDEKGNLLSRTKMKPNGNVDWKWTYSYSCQQIEVLY